jgi:hypothetical protein
MPLYSPYPIEEEVDRNSDIPPDDNRGSTNIAVTRQHVLAQSA